MTTNERLMDWLSARAQRAYREDIALILAYGSAVNGTANPRSDLDCYFIPATERGNGFGLDFILNGIGYDIFPMSWERVEGIAALREVLSPLVGDVKVLYCRNEEDLARFRGLQRRLQANLGDRAYTQGIARERFALACGLYRQMEGGGRFARLRALAGQLIMALADMIAVANGDYFHYGLKKQPEELERFAARPEGFLEDYRGVMRAEDGPEIMGICLRMLERVGQQLGLAPEPVAAGAAETAEPAPGEPDYGELADIYMEICSTFNKIYACHGSGNPELAFLSAVCLQRELDELAQEYGIPACDILGAYRYSDLEPLAAAAKRAEEALVQTIQQGGGHIQRYHSLEAFFAANR